jgi:hypothetical protein
MVCVSDHISIEFGEDSLGFNFGAVHVDGDNVFKVLKTQPNGEELGVHVGHNIEAIAGVRAKDIGSARAVFDVLTSAPRPLTIVFSNNKNVGNVNEDSLVKTYRIIKTLRNEFSALRKSGEFQNGDFETKMSGTGSVKQRFVRRHTEYAATMAFVATVEAAKATAAGDAKAAEAAFRQRFGLVRRNNPLSRQRGACEDARQNLVTRWESVEETLAGILAMARHLEQRRAPHPCERDVDMSVTVGGGDGVNRCKSTLATDPCWVYGGADHVVSGVPSIATFYPVKSTRP